MIESGIEVIKTAFERATGEGRYITLYIFTLILACLYMKEKKQKTFIVNYGVVSILIIFNPIVSYILSEFINLGSNVYWRTFWCIPLGVTIAYIFTDIVFSKESKIKRIILIISFIFLIIYSGTLIYTKEVFQKVNNWYKIPDDELLAINIILNQQQGEETKIFVPTEMIAHVRQIDTSIEIAYNRNPSGDYSKIDVLTYLNENKFEEALNKLKEKKCEYLVWYKNEELDKNGNFKKVGETLNYNIYKIM